MADRNAPFGLSDLVTGSAARDPWADFPDVPDEADPWGAFPDAPDDDPPTRTATGSWGFQRGGPGNSDRVLSYSRADRLVRE